jgi:hypothetical protein
MLCDLKHKTLPVVIAFHSVQQTGQLMLLKTHVNDSADNLDDLADAAAFCFFICHF